MSLGLTAASFQHVAWTTSHMYTPGFALTNTLSFSCNLPLNTTFSFRKNTSTFENLANFPKQNLSISLLLLAATMKRDNFLNGELTSDSD